MTTEQEALYKKAYRILEELQRKFADNYRKAHPNIPLSKLWGSYRFFYVNKRPQWAWASNIDHLWPTPEVEDLIDALNKGDMEKVAYCNMFYSINGYLPRI
jgi:hypothetical protein